MQILALDGADRHIFASDAEKQLDYYCRECRGVVRVRGGIHRKNHFFHLASSLSCRQSQKSLTHLQIQYFLQALLPPRQCELERQFPEIGRIADVVWEPQKLVFEVQCSPISKEEVERRNNDYKSLGYQVIWILHERRFNRWRASAAEIYLKSVPHYFTNIDSRGCGEIYDQVDILQGAMRRTFRKILGVNLRTRQTLSQSEVPILFTKALRNRWTEWPLFFEGDLMDLYLKGDKETLHALEKAISYEKSFYQRATSPFYPFIMKVMDRVFVRPYSTFLKILLEKSCR